MADEKQIPALLRKDVIATPLPFKEVATMELGFNPPVAPAVASNGDQMWAKLREEAIRLKQATGIDWAVGNAVCEACSTTFGTVQPASENVFPCPKCHTHRARWKYAFIKPGRHWACVCGNVTFRFAEGGGLYCPQCGVDQEALEVRVKGG